MASCNSGWSVQCWFRWHKNNAAGPTIRLGRQVGGLGLLSPAGKQFESVLGGWL